MSEEVFEHVDHIGAYVKVFIALMILLFATVGAYLYDFGAHWGPQYGVLNTALALVIATIKAGLVMLVFMHLRHATKLTWVIALAGFLWLCVMICFSYADYLSRAALPEYNPNLQLENPPAVVQSATTQPTSTENTNM